MGRYRRTGKRDCSRHAGRRGEQQRVYRFAAGGDRRRGASVRVQREVDAGAGQLKALRRRCCVVGDGEGARARGGPVGRKDELQRTLRAHGQSRTAGIAAGNDGEVAGHRYVVNGERKPAIVGQRHRLRRCGKAHAGGREGDRRVGRERHAGRRDAGPAQRHGLAAELVRYGQNAGFWADALGHKRDQQRAGRVAGERVAATIHDGKVAAGDLRRD